MSDIQDEYLEGYIVQENNDGGSYFAMRSFGDSMNVAGIGDGDVLIIRQQDIVKNGDFVIAELPDGRIVCRAWHQESSLIILSPRSTNNAYPLLCYDTNEVVPRILGRVVQIRKELL